MALHYNGRYNPSSDLEILVWQPASLDTDVLSTGRETEKVLPTTWVERITCEIECESLPFESVHFCDFKGSIMAEELAVCWMEKPEGWQSHPEIGIISQATGNGRSYTRVNLVSSHVQFLRSSPALLDDMLNKDGILVSQVSRKISVFLLDPVETKRANRSQQSWPRSRWVLGCQGDGKDVMTSSVVFLRSL